MKKYSGQSKIDIKKVAIVILLCFSISTAAMSYYMSDLALTLAKNNAKVKTKVITKIEVADRSEVATKTGSTDEFETTPEIEATDETEITTKVNKSKPKKIYVAKENASPKRAHEKGASESTYMATKPEGIDFSSINPYINLGMSQNLGANVKTGITLDAFVPVIEDGNGLFFSNIKLNSYSNQTFDGGIYFGYRHLLQKKQMLYGIYTSFDFKQTKSKNYFKQITLGIEYWIKKWFLGGRIFSPIGEREDMVERSLRGASAEIGYEFSKKSGLYLEGYVLKSSYEGNVPGAKIKLKQKLFDKEDSSSVLKRMNLEIGAQKDKITGNRLFLALNFKLGGSFDDSTVPEGVASHLTDTISRDVTIYTEKRQRTRVITCYYGYNSGNGDLLDTSTMPGVGGSDPSCPLRRSDALKDPRIKVLTDEGDRIPYGDGGHNTMTLRICEYNKCDPDQK